MANPNPKSALIIGGGIAGCCIALALHLPSNQHHNITCTIFEGRSEPSTLGGAINITPNALRLLEYLGVETKGLGCVVDAIEIFSYHTGAKLGELSFRGESGHAMRVERAVLQKALLRAVEKQGVKVVYGRKLVGVKEFAGEEKLIVQFANGAEEEGDFVIGCDGMFSATRMNYVEEERKPIYTGVAAAYGILDLDEGGRDVVEKRKEIHFSSTAMNSGRYGSLLSSYSDSEKKRVYLAVVMEADEQDGKEGWRVRGRDQDATLKEVRRRYKDSAFPCLLELFEEMKEFMFYPVFKLTAGGSWIRGNVVLIGDAAHGMPPQGESTGLAMEDAVLLGRCIEKFSGKPIKEAFEAYAKTRKPRIDKSYKEANTRWERVKDYSWFMQKMIEWLIWVFVWWKSADYEKSFAYDVRKEEILS